MRLDVALAQHRPSKGDPANGFDRVADRLAEAVALERPPDLIVFPETAVSGYFLEGGVREHALASEEMLARLDAAGRRAGLDGRAIDVVIGFYERHDGHLFNSALYAELGDGDARLRHVHRKVFLPTYGVFQEERFVEAGETVAVFDTRLGRAAILICEDFWHPSATRAAASQGAEILLVPSASPARGAAPGPGVPANVARWTELAATVADRHGIPVVVSQLVGFEGGKGFAGGSVACSAAGDLVHRSVLWDEALDVVSLDMESAASSAAAAGSAGGQAGPDVPATAGAGASSSGPEAIDRDEAVERGFADRPPPAEGARDPGPLLGIDTTLVEDWLVRFLREEMALRRGFERAVVGISGGVDSAVTAALCARAFGPGNVHGFLMPYATSSPESAAHGRLVADQFGIPVREIDITAAVDGYLAPHEPDADGTRRGNVMARTRMIVLFDQAAKLGALPVGTGNKSERLLGYFTWHADDSPPINPLGDLFKTQVWALARHLGLPREVIEKPASADLVRGQTDEADLGVSYTEADMILLHLVEGRSPEWLVAAGFEASHVRTVRRRLEGTHWKRNLPTVAMLSSTTIGEWYLRPVDY